MIFQVDSKCPKCGSDDVEVGCVVLSCLDCGWTLVGETPCDTCGAPSVGVCGARGVTHYYCREHSPDLNVLFQELAKALTKPIFDELERDAKESRTENYAH